MSQEVIFTTVVVAGLLDSLNPCAISVALLFVAILFTLQKSRSLILRIGFVYILSIFLTYLVIGLGLFKAIHLFNTPHFFAKLGAIIAIIFGLLNLKEYFFPNLPFKIRMSFNIRRSISEWAHKASLPAAIVMGVLVDICEFPCSGSVYLAIVGLLSVKTSFFQGTAYLILYNFIFVLPLILIFLLSTNRMVVEKTINWQERQGRKMHIILAFLMIGLGVLILTYFV